MLPVQSTDVFNNDADVHRIVSKKLLAPQVTDWMSPKGLSEHFINQSTSSRAAFTHSQNNSPKLPKIPIVALERICLQHSQADMTFL